MSGIRLGASFAAGQAIHLCNIIDAIIAGKNLADIQRMVKGDPGGVRIIMRVRMEARRRLAGGPPAKRKPGPGASRPDLFEAAKERGIPWCVVQKRVSKHPTEPDRWLTKYVPRPYRRLRPETLS